MRYHAGHYAYTHSTPDGTVFYVGKGFGRRAYALSNRPAQHQAKIDAIGRQAVVVTLYPAPTDAEARNIERDMIASLAASGAPLFNMEGVTPRKLFGPAAPKKKSERPNGSGRPPKAPEDRTRPHTIRLTSEDWEQLKRLGSEWLARTIDEAPEPLD